MNSEFVGNNYFLSKLRVYFHIGEEQPDTLISPSCVFLTFYPGHISSELQLSLHRIARTWKSPKNQLAHLFVGPSQLPSLKLQRLYEDAPENLPQENLAE